MAGNDFVGVHRSPARAAREEVLWKITGEQASLKTLSAMHYKGLSLRDMRNAAAPLQAKSAGTSPKTPQRIPLRVITGIAAAVTTPKGASAAVQGRVSSVRGRPERRPRSLANGRVEVEPIQVAANSRQLRVSSDTWPSHHPLDALAHSTDPEQNPYQPVRDP